MTVRITHAPAECRFAVIIKSFVTALCQDIPCDIEAQEQEEEATA